MIFINESPYSDQLHSLLFHSMIVPDVQFINDRVEGKSIAIDIIPHKDEEILYFKKGKRAAQMLRTFTQYKIRQSRDPFLMHTYCPAVIIKSNNINIKNIAEALLEL